MGYMQIAQKHAAKMDVENAADKKMPGDAKEDMMPKMMPGTQPAGALTNKSGPAVPSKAVASVQQPVNKVKKTTKQKTKTLPFTNNPVPGTPYAALTSLMKK